MSEQENQASDQIDSEATDTQPGVQELGTQVAAEQPQQDSAAEAAPAPVAAVEQAAPQVVQAPVKTAPVVTLKQPAAAEGFMALIEGIKADGTDEQKRMILGIEQYMERMAPGLALDFNDGARHQHMLWKLLQGVIERAPQEQFKKMWSIILGYFEEYKDGVFGDRYVYRFSEFWHQGEAELSAFQRIVNVIKLTSNHEERALGLRQVDLARSLEQGFTEQGRQRVVGFYQQ